MKSSQFGNPILLSTLSSLLLLICGLSPAQTLNASKDTLHSISEVSIGSYQTNNEGIQKNFGNLLRFGGTYGRELLPAFDIGGKFAYMHDKKDLMIDSFAGQNIKDTHELTLFELMAFARYVIPRSNFYIGGGFALLSYTEQVTGQYNSGGKVIGIDETAQETVIGPALIFGGRLYLTSAQDVWFSLEGIGSTMKDDLGGLSLNLGLGGSY